MAAELFVYYRITGADPGGVRDVRTPAHLIRVPFFKALKLNDDGLQSCLAQKLNVLISTISVRWTFETVGRCRFQRFKDN